MTLTLTVSTRQSRVMRHDYLCYSTIDSSLLTRARAAMGRVAVTVTRAREYIPT